MTMFDFDELLTLFAEANSKSLKLILDAARAAIAVQVWGNGTSVQKVTVG